MAKFYGKIGYVFNQEVSPGVWKDDCQEIFYTGDLFQNSRRWQSSESVNDDLVVTNEISIIADDFVSRNYGYMRYVDLNGTRWKISSAHLEYPRIRISLGNVYNGIHGPSSNI